MDIHSACDYIIIKVRRYGATLNVLKLQKLLYFAQCWHLALEGELLFQGKFQAWPQGPINREIYDRFAASKSLDCEVRESDVSGGSANGNVSNDERAHLDRIIGAYANYEDRELHLMIVRQAPWQEASGRGGERCEREIDEDSMRRYCAVQYLAGLRGIALDAPSATALLPFPDDLVVACPQVP